MAVLVLKTILCLALLVMVKKSNCQLPSPKGLHFIGVGYNLLKGNPEGGDLDNGGVDPGLLFTRKVFQLTYFDEKESVDRVYSVPDQIVFAPRDSCVTTHKKDTFAGEKSYQAKLSTDVTVSTGYNTGIYDYAFTMSKRCEEVKKRTSKQETVFYEEKTVCNRGRARYQYDLSANSKFPVSREFAAAVCGLPSEYTESDYMQFVERWGTHVVIEVELGTKTVERFTSTLTEFMKFAMKEASSSVAPSGTYKGFQSSLKVDFTSFQESMNSQSKFGENKVTFTSGGEELPEPIGLTLLPINEALNPLYFETWNTDCTELSRLLNARGCCSLDERRENLLRALEGYPEYKKAKIPKDPVIQIPLTWPIGTYGFPMPGAGCPKDSGFKWHQGLRFHDTEDDDSANRWSVPLHLAGRLSKNNLNQYFCMKTQERGSSYDMDWPKGQYCIFKKRKCPLGFNTGLIKWDDEDILNSDTYGGTVPDGTYNSNTMIYYCCRTDGHATNKIFLPTDWQFVLFPYSHECQQVHGMKVRREWLQWDTEDLLKLNDHRGAVPFGVYGNNIRLYYCYYH